MDRKDQEFRALMRHYKPDKAPAGFSGRVMDELFRIPNKIEYKPVFGRYFLPVFLVGLIGFVAIVLLIGNIKSGSGICSGMLQKVPQANFWNVSELSNQFVSWFRHIPSAIGFAVFVMFVLLGVDRLLSRYFHSPKA